MLRKNKTRYSDFKVLVVEENDINRVLLLRNLAEKGFDTGYSTNGLEAIRELEKQKYNLVLVNLTLPVLDGFETAGYIRNVLKMGIPIIGISRKSSDRVYRKCIDHGMNGYINLPVNIQDIERISELIMSDPESKSDQKNETFELEKCEKESLPEKLPGLDVHKGLEICDNSERFYLDLLRAFLKHYSDYDQVLAEYFKHRKMGKLKFSMHKLKGAVANVGAQGLYKLLDNTETALEQGQTNGFEGTLVEVNRQIRESVNSMKLLAG